MSLCSPWKRIILICVCGWQRVGWKETKSWSDVESTQWRSRFGRTNIFLCSCKIGLHSKTLKSANIVDNYRTMFESRISAERTEKLPNSETFRLKSSSKFHKLWQNRPVSQWDSSGISPGFNTLQLSQEVQELLLRLNEHQRISQEGSSSCRCSTTSHGDQKTNKIECESNAQLVSLFGRRFGAGQRSFFGLGSKKKLYSISEDSPQGEWGKMAEKMMVTLASQKADTQFFELRVHCPEVSSKAKAVSNCRSTIVPTRSRLQLFFSIRSVLTEQSQKCVKNMNHFMTGRNPLW